MDYKKEIGPIYYLRYAMDILSNAKLNGGQCSLGEYIRLLGGSDREVFFSEILPKFGKVDWWYADYPGVEGKKMYEKFTLSAEGEKYADKVVQLLKELSLLLDSDLTISLTDAGLQFGQMLLPAEP